MGDVVIKLNREKLIAAMQSLASETHPPGRECTYTIFSPDSGSGWRWSCGVHCCNGESTDNQVVMRALLLECLSR